MKISEIITNRNADSVELVRFPRDAGKDNVKMKSDTR